MLALTCEKKAQLLQKLTDIRRDLILQLPFYGTLLMHLKFGLARCQTAGTDMERILWDPDFLDRLTEEETAFVLLHEVMHCVLGHCTRGKGKIHLLYNIAADIVVNSLILDSLGETDFIVDGEKAMHLAPNGCEGKNYTADQVYEMLLRQYQDEAGDLDQTEEAQGQNPSLPDDQEKPDSGGQEDPDSGDQEDPDSANRKPQPYGTLDNHEIWESVGEGDEDARLLEEIWKGNLREAVERGGEGLVCTFPPQLRELVEDAFYQPRINWRQVLNDFIQIIAESYDYTFDQPDRRFSGGDFILPSFCQLEGEKVENIWLAVDTSGSIDDDILNAVFQEIRASLTQFTSLSGKISFFDTSVTDPEDFENAEDLQKIRAQGGGGTSFYAIFEYMNRNMKENPPAAVIVLTDGYADYPEESMASDIPVVWVLIDNPEDAPWGKSVHVSLG